MRNNRVFLMVLDSLGIGNAPDAEAFGDEGANTLKSCYDTKELNIPVLSMLGLYNIDGINYGEHLPNKHSVYGRLVEMSADKDTITGHREMMGIVSDKRMPTFPNGFPEDFIKEFEKRIHRKVLCNKPYSGTEVLKDYGKQQVAEGAVIVYTSGDSVFQIAAHCGIVQTEEQYEICKIAREMLTGDLAVGRVIARPFCGVYPNFERVSWQRHDYALPLDKNNGLSILQSKGIETIGVGKIGDIFSHTGLNKSYPTGKNAKGFEKCFELLDSAPDNSLIFANFVDFDSEYGHRRNVEGYTKCLNEFDKFLYDFINKMNSKDYLIITADHGCDPCFMKTTDHTRECVPLLVYNKAELPQDRTRPCTLTSLSDGRQNLGTIAGFDTVYKFCEKILL